MSIRELFKKTFGLCESLSSKEVMAVEKESVAENFSQHFDKQYQDYLTTDYKQFIESDYPAYVTEKYSYVKPENFPDKDRPLYALSLSGGGIRSAAFGIGVIQALNNDGFVEPGKPTLFSKLSYLSTVSGGGYAGASLSWFMKLSNVFPFGDISSFSGSKQNGEKSNRILSYIRLHGKYLTPPALPTITLVGSVLGSALHSLIAYTALLSVLMFCLIMFISNDFLTDLLSLQHDALPIYDVAVEQIKQLVNINASYTYEAHQVSFSLFFMDIALLSAALFIVTVIIYGASSYYRRLISQSYSYRILTQKLLGYYLSVLIISIIFMILPLQALLLMGATMEADDPAFWGSGGAGIGAIIMSILEFKKRSNVTQRGSSLWTNAVKILIVGLFIFFILAATYIIGEALYDLSKQADIRKPLGIHANVYIAIALAFTVVVNINQISPHKMYRDRLMDTFLRDPDVPASAPLRKKGRKANNTKLAELNSDTHWAPYHLINCNVILNNSSNPQFHTRLGDSFLLSPKYCGSDATRYVKTDQFALGSMSIATAMAISGAAANPHAGVGGKGALTTPLVSFLLTFFGFRLGFWANNPRSTYSRIKAISRPTYIYPGSGSLFNFGHTEHSRYIELSDGGHFDNTGLYELVRRRVPFIILSDGSADELAQFDDLGNALSKIRIDFGVSIRFNDPELNLSGLIPGSQRAATSQTGQSTYDEKYDLSERGFAIGDIVYPTTDSGPGFIGTFIYIKTSMTRNLPGDLYTYKSNNPTFPNQPTSDQFFDERQFESYRELGYQLTKQLLTDESAKKRII